MDGHLIFCRVYCPTLPLVRSFSFPVFFFFSGGGENKRERANDVFILFLVSGWHHLLTSEARVGRYRGYGLYPGSFDGEAERRVLLSAVSLLFFTCCL